MAGIESCEVKKRKHEEDTDEEEAISVLQKFQLVKVLKEDTAKKFMVVEGRIPSDLGTGNNEDGRNNKAVLLLEKKPVVIDGIEELTRFGSAKLTFVNDCYSNYQLASSKPLHDVKVTLINPATEKHIMKYTEQERFVVHETAEIYKTVTLPVAEKQTLAVEEVKMDGNEKMIFVLGDKLPTIYDVGIAIFNVATNPKSDKMKHCIRAYVNALIAVWIKSFGNEHLKARQHIRKRVEMIVSHYYNHVYVEHHRTKPKKKGPVHVKKSIRQLNREWREKSLHITNKKLEPINSLLDIGKDMDGLTGHEKPFYDDQKGARLCRLSEEIDTEYAAEGEQEEAKRLEEVERQGMEESFMRGDNLEDQTKLQDTSGTSQMDVSINRSGHASRMWVYNILDKKAEVDKVVFEDPDPQNGFILLPDMKWNGTELESLYLVAIVHKRGIKSMRDLDQSHLPLLKNILKQSPLIVSEKYDVPPCKLRMYCHYEPSYYHFHVHINHIKFDCPGKEILRAHLLSDIIDNIEMKSNYYQEKTLSFLVAETSLLYKELKNAGHIDNGATLNSKSS